ncbi:hypothetical protein GGR50DRAFT_644210 [Xylaria sp. CBS 124048]|nr:hypothetical protein GGR50DRAFT_644210 [Xylaria sp. CBS 124048]
MPPSPALFELSTRKFICNSCLSALRKRSTVSPWPVRRLSQAADAAAHDQTKRRSPEQEAERLKTLETLGLLKKDNNNNTGTTATNNKLAVNFFEQGDNGRLRRLEDENEFGRALVDPGGELDARLKELEDQLQSVTSITKAIVDMGGKEEAERLRKQFAQGSDRDIEDLFDDDKHPSIVALAIPIDRLNSHAREHVSRLNTRIRGCIRALEKNKISPKDIGVLWRGYTVAHASLRERWDIVPEAVWGVLWKVLSADYEFNTNRMAHIYDLAKDMQEAGVALRPEQQMLALEAMFAERWVNQAIENHRRHVSTLGANPETFVRFWQLGLQMYCEVGDIERAERIARTISESSYESDPRFILPLIKSCAERPETLETSFRLYRDLRAQLGDSMVIEDYDTIISYFLVTGNTEYALFVFVDMMKSGSIDLLGVEEYPQTIANSFFFGKWLKRLIGMGDLEGAYNVMRFMRSKAITPPAIQVNGLIGAWLRSGTARNMEMAEDVAWAMINARIQFVELRRRESSVDGLNLHPSGDGWPRATLETFSLLAENYKERGLATKMGPLWQSFRESAITPNSFMLNQILVSLLQEGKAELVQDTYQDFIKEFNFKPDSHTFMILWQALPVNRFTKLPQEDFDTEISRTRALFAETIKHAAIFKSNGNMVMDDFLARNIFHSFRKLQDRAGLLLAFRAFRRIIGYNPPDMVAFELLLGTQDLQRLAQRREGSKLIRARVALDHYLAHRYKELVKAGEIEADKEMSLAVKTEETGNFMEYQLESQFSSDMDIDKAQRIAIAAAKEMGLPARGSKNAQSGQASS